MVGSVMGTINKADTFDFTDVTDEQIQTVIKYKRRQIENLQAQLKVLENDLTYYQDALYRRKLDALFAANEGLRLEVGDRLLALCPSRYSKDEDIEFGNYPLTVGK